MKLKWMLRLVEAQTMERMGPNLSDADGEENWEFKQRTDEEVARRWDYFVLQ